ncbi:hypothetical protein ACHMP6_00100 [Candidatus Phytoplasma palmae]
MKLISLIFLILFIIIFLNYYNNNALKVFLDIQSDKIYKNIYIKNEKNYKTKGSNQSSCVNLSNSNSNTKIKEKNKIFDSEKFQISNFSCFEIDEKINSLEMKIIDLKTKNNQLKLEAKNKAFKIDNIKRTLLLKGQFIVPKDSELDSLVLEVNRLIQEVGRERCIKQ